MEKYAKATKVKIRLLLCLMLLLTVSCAHHEGRAPAGSLDFPEHHVYSGVKLLDKNLLGEARREFTLALELDPEHSPAYNGLGLVLGYRGDFEQAFKNMSMAKKYSRSKMEKASVYVGYMRLFTLQKGKGWLQKVRTNFHNALNVMKDMPEAHFYMGMAYKEAYRFAEAGREFARVLTINKLLVGEADEQLRLVQKIERAMPGSKVGKKLALQEKITRADTAAIFVQELKLDKIYTLEKMNSIFLKTIPSDIKDHPLRTDIETVLKLDVRGLEVFPEGDFDPDALITRAAYAMMVEDILGTITHNRELAMKNIGNSSPFPDVSPHAPYFNAVMVCTTRGLIEPADIGTGAFQPAGYIKGADALLVIRKLKEELKIF